jgi:hypothetical protein
MYHTQLTEPPPIFFLISKSNLSDTIFYEETFHKICHKIKAGGCVSAAPSFMPNILTTQKDVSLLLFLMKKNLWYLCKVGSLL